MHQSIVYAFKDCLKPTVLISTNNWDLSQMLYWQKHIITLTLLINGSFYYTLRLLEYNLLLLVESSKRYVWMNKCLQPGYTCNYVLGNTYFTSSCQSWCKT